MLQLHTGEITSQVQKSETGPQPFDKGGENWGMRRGGGVRVGARVEGGGGVRGGQDRPQSPLGVHWAWGSSVL